MKRVLFIMDSCRYDSYKLANTKKLYNLLGSPSKGITCCNWTLPSMIDIILFNHLPKPNNKKQGIKHVNYLKDIKMKGTKTYFYSTMAYLHQGFTIPKSISKYCEVYKNLDHRDYGICDIFDMTRNILKEEDNFYLIIWLHETHHPYNFGDSKTESVSSYNIYHYNRGKDTMTKKYLEYLHTRQIKAVEYITEKMYDFIKGFNGDIIITSDHGESFGENHKFGHGHSIHPCQFTVPYIERLSNNTINKQENVDTND